MAFASVMQASKYSENFISGKSELAQQAHGHNAGIEVQRHDRVLDAQHRMVEHEALGQGHRAGINAGMNLGIERHE